MVTSNAPVRVPERQPEPTDNSNNQSRQSSWRQAKKPTRFVIKLSTYIPV